MLVVAVVAVPVILLGFDGLFLRFHEVFFSGDTWRFSTTDTLLRLYPEVFWQHTAQLASAIVVVQAVAVALVARWWLRRLRPVSRGAVVIELHRPTGGVLRIGHRGAAALAPENTLRSFRAAVETGVDLIEFDVLDLRRGPLVLAHSDHLDEVSHGAASGRVRDLSLDALRVFAPELPTFDDALAFFVDEAPGVGLHIDLKLRTRLDELARRDRAPRARGAHRRQRRARREPAGPSPAPRPASGSGSRIRRTGSRSPASRTCGRSSRSGSRRCGRRCRCVSRGSPVAPAPAP